jgi:HPt (histidine-containing phosphotransfer) domain-containing protein
MGSIKHHPRRAISATENIATSEKLQELFAVRLQSERVHFVTLSAALARAEESPGGIFDDLTFRAHRLKGAAATFDFANLAAAAGALERASFAAANSRAAHTDPEVWEALVALVDMLGVIEQNTPRAPDLPPVLLAD